MTFRPGSLAIVVLAAAALAAPLPAQAQGKKPNIVIIWGDDIGQTNVSAYSRGLMGYTTPNIIATFKAYPPRQKAASFTVDQVLQTLQKPSGG